MMIYFLFITFTELVKVSTNPPVKWQLGSTLRFFSEFLTKCYNKIINSQQKMMAPG